MNASGPGSSVCCSASLSVLCACRLQLPVDHWRDQTVVKDRWPNVRVQRLGPGLDTFAADDDPHLLDAGTAQEPRRFFTVERRDAFLIMGRPEIREPLPAASIGPTKRYGNGRMDRE